MSRRTIGLCLVLWIGAGSCTINPFEIDLTVRGNLNFLISRQSPGAVALATASVTDRGATGSPLIELQPNQIFSVNGVDLQRTHFATYAASLDAVYFTNQYTITFNNAGTSLSMKLAPPLDRTMLAPAPGEQVSKSGFNVLWRPTGKQISILGDLYVKRGLEIRGFIPDGDDADTDPDLKVVTLPDPGERVSPGDMIPGTAVVSAADLNGFLNGPITVKFVLFHEVAEDIGLATGTIRVEINHEISLILTD